MLPPAFTGEGQTWRLSEVGFLFFRTLGRTIGHAVRRTVTECHHHVMRLTFKVTVVDATRDLACTHPRGIV